MRFSWLLAVLSGDLTSGALIATNAQAMDVTGAQIRAARVLLGIDGPELAEKAGVALSTVRRFENGAPGSKLAKNAMVRALQELGIEFIPRGVQLREGPLKDRE
jgi:transcriptional regulator with XRE-family HTH domain